jgi:hypothetical protein
MAAPCWRHPGPCQGRARLLLSENPMGRGSSYEGDGAGPPAVGGAHARYRNVGPPLWLRSAYPHDDRRPAKRARGSCGHGSTPAPAGQQCLGVGRPLVDPLRFAAGRRGGLAPVTALAAVASRAAREATAGQTVRGEGQHRLPAAHRRYRGGPNSREAPQRGRKGLERREGLTTNTPRSVSVKTGLRQSLWMLLLITALSGSLARAGGGAVLTAGLVPLDVTSAEHARRQERREEARPWALEGAQAAGAIARLPRAWQEGRRSCAENCRRCRIVCNADYHACRDTCSGLNTRRYSLCIDQCAEDRSTCTDSCED